MTTVPARSHATLERLQQLCKDMLASRRLIIASNRGPVEFRLESDGSLSSQRASGGLVTALTAASRFVPVTWVANAITDGDRKAAASAADGRIEVPDLDIRVRFVVSPRATYQRFYYVFANPLLWFLQHYMWNTPRTPNIGRSIYEAWEGGYIPVNQAIAAAIVDEAKADPEPPYIMLHDYHLYLAAAHVREQIPQATILHFTHIPWPGPRYWGILPEIMRRAIHQSLLACDIVGLQTRNDVRNFLHCCEAMLRGATIDYHECSVTYHEHTTYICHYPISIDASGLLEFAQSEEVKRYEDQLRPCLGQKTVVRVDRSEPSKNVVRGLRAWELLLERYPEYRGKASFLHFLVPSRSELSVYQTYADEIFELVDSINDQYADDEWQPVHVFYENNYAQAIAGMRLYDVLLVNPLVDGMNLVSKEGPLVNKGDGVLILSEQAGSHEQLSEYAISICPTDLEGTVRALHEALNMSGDERRRRAAALMRLVQEEDICFWLERQLRDLMAASKGGL
ncbi:MAG: trehalose-6-phosphate synthase [Dehalococcoidia bacterium]